VNVVCLNEECPEYEILKDNSAGHAVEESICGHCSGPVTEADEVADDG